MQVPEFLNKNSSYSGYEEKRFSSIANALTITLIIERF